MSATVKRMVENIDGKLLLMSGAQRPGCMADERRGEGADVRIRDRAEAEDNAADGVFGRSRHRPPVVLTIAGTDTSGGAGLQSDIKTFQDLGVYGLSVVTAVTSQNTQGVREVYPLEQAVIAAQIDALKNDFSIKAIKTGMLYSRYTVESVAAFVSAEAPVPLVVDPVTVAHSGGSLSEHGLLLALRTILLPLATVVTPNASEAALLCDMPVEDLAQARVAAGALCDLGSQAAIVTGIVTEQGIADVFCFAGDTGFEVMPALAKANVHGSGCTFSAALAAGLASGMPLPEALRCAKRYTYRSLAGALEFGTGQLMSAHGCDII